MKRAVKIMLVALALSAMTAATAAAEPNGPKLMSIAGPGGVWDLAAMRTGPYGPKIELLGYGPRGPIVPFGFGPRGPVIPSIW